MAAGWYIANLHAEKPPVLARQFVMVIADIMKE